MAALGAACVLATGEPQLLPDRLAALILLLGALAAFYYHSHNRSQHEVTPPAAGDGSSRNSCGCAPAAIYRDALPNWIGQVEAARNLTEEAISSLASHFSRMSQRVESAATAAHNGAAMRGGLAFLLGDSRQELEATVVSLRAALATKEALQHEVEELSRLTEQLRAMAREVGSIAEQTSQVAFNAALADQGRHGVAIVAHQLGKLCSQFGETSKRIGETADAVNAAIASTLVASQQYGEQSAATANHSRQAIEHVIKRFRGATTSLLESSRDLREESQAVGQEITQVLASLQFQERVTQSLGLVRSDLEKLQRNFAQADTARRHLPTPASATRVRHSRAA
jgi:methyl-accepting chemotaxis protein